MASTLTKAQKAEALREIRVALERAKNNGSEAARSVGLSQQSFNKAIKDGQIGVENVRRMATRLGRAVAGIAPEDAPEVAAAVTRAVEREDRYPSRAAVLDAARAKGVDPVAIEMVREMALHADSDPGAESWVDELRKAVAVARSLDDLVGEPFDDTDLVASPAPAPRKRR